MKYLALFFGLIAAMAIALIAQPCCASDPTGSPFLVGSEIEFPPFAIVDEQGQPSGFSIDLIKAVALAMGMDIKIEPDSWDVVWNKLVDGELDILPLVAINSERGAVVDFSLPHTETFDAFFVSNGAPTIGSIAEAKGKKVIVMRSDFADHILSEGAFDGTIVRAETIPEGLRLLGSGGYDALLCSKLIGALAIKNNGINGVSAGPVISDYKREFAFGIRKGDLDLQERLNQGLLIVKSNGEYQRIYEKWFEFTDPWIRYRQYLLVIIGSLAVATLLALLWALVLRRSVANRTRELEDKNYVLAEAVAAHSASEAELVGYKAHLEDKVEERAQALVDSEKRFRSFFDLGLIGMAITSPEKGWILVNDLLCEMLGYTREELNDRQWSDLTHPDDITVDLQHFSRVLEGEIDGYRLDKRFICKDGSILHTNLSVKCLRHDDGTINYFVVLMQDTTEAKRIEAEQQRAREEKAILERNLLETQKLEGLGVLAGGIAHDFNNLLTGILGYTDLLDGLIPEESEAAKYLTNIKRATNHAGDLTRQMLAYSGRGQFIIEPVNISSLVHEMMDLLQASLSKTAIMSLHLDPDVLSIHCDLTQVRQIVMNLIVNASDAVGDNPGQVTVRTGSMEVDSEFLAGLTMNAGIEAGDHCVFFEVQDTGCGMDERTMERIFEPFFTTKFVGRGLGLSAVFGIVRGHEGAIRIASNPGQGSTFTVLFPLSTPDTGEPALSAPPQETPSRSTPGTVLVIDDEEVVRTLAVDMLVSSGRKTIKAADGTQGLALYREHAGDIDTVLLDLTMPGMQGQEVFRELIAIDPQVRVILMSGYSEDEVMRNFRDVGLAGFLQKPFTMASLLSSMCSGNRTVVE